VGAMVASVRRGRGFPVPDTAGHSRFQPAATDQDTAESLSQAGGEPGKTCLKHQRTMRSEENQHKKQPYEHERQRISKG